MKGSKDNIYIYDVNMKKRFKEFIYAIIIAIVFYISPLLFLFQMEQNESLYWPMLFVVGALTITFPIALFIYYRITIILTTIEKISEMNIILKRKGKDITVPINSIKKVVFYWHKDSCAIYTAKRKYWMLLHIYRRQEEITTLIEDKACRSNNIKVKYITS